MAKNFYQTLNEIVNSWAPTWASVGMTFIIYRYSASGVVFNGAVSKTPVAIGF